MKLADVKLPHHALQVRIVAHLNPHRVRLVPGRAIPARVAQICLVSSPAHHPPRGHRRARNIPPQHEARNAGQRRTIRIAQLHKHGVRPQCRRAVSDLTVTVITPAPHLGPAALLSLERAVVEPTPGNVLQVLSVKHVDAVDAHDGGRELVGRLPRLAVPELAVLVAPPALHDAGVVQGAAGRIRGEEQFLGCGCRRASEQKRDDERLPRASSVRLESRRSDGARMPLGARVA
mmetsp:Transcript_8836/g.37382  ORF Transcript_8836/g.37382 Transcript_8836/m.37382 type:complete len:233 (-) Transcript_8836:143-841(-)